MDEHFTLVEIPVYVCNSYYIPRIFNRNTRVVLEFSKYVVHCEIHHTRIEDVIREDAEAQFLEAKHHRGDFERGP